MKPLTIAKLALAIVGIMVFGVGIRLESRAIRWTGVGCLAAAWLVRFAKDREGN